MRTNLIIISILLLCVCAQQAVAGPGGKIAKKGIEKVLKKAAARGGCEIAEQTMKKSARETLERIAKTYGDDALKVVRECGPELIESVPKYGDEVIEIATKASPAARQAFARDVPNLLPLVRRFGVEAIELEAKAPGMAAKIFSVFGDDVGRAVARNVPKEDIPRLLAYAERADSPATRKLLMETYQREGKTLFQRIPPKLVLAGGLSASMIYGTHRITEPIIKTAAAVERNEAKVIRHFYGWTAGIVLTLMFTLLWRFRLMPWHGRKSSPAAECVRPQPQRNQLQ